MAKTANTDLNAITAPTTAEMLEMLNVDVLPFFDGYDESTFSFSEKYRAESVVAETENGFVISLNDGKEIEVAKAYFQFPGTEKANVLFALKNTLS
jgi:hypothetical protein